MSIENKSDTILLGTAFQTINPPEGIWLIGYPNPEKRANTGVALDLCARAAVFGSVQTQAPLAAVVVLDTLGVSADLVRRIRKCAAERIKGLAAESILVAATHTHSGPALMPIKFAPDHGGQTKPLADYVERVVESAAEALTKAWEARTTGSLRLGRTELRMGHNRRVVDAKGQAVNDWFDLENRHTGFFNPNVRILLFEDSATRKPKAVLSLYGCHPVTLGPGNKKVSADYPGYFVRAVEAALPGCFAMHLTGAAADINPRGGALADDAENAKPYGDALAKVVLDEFPHTRPICALPISVHSETLTLPLGPDAHENYSCRAEDSVDGKTITSEVQVLRLGEVALVSSPGELFGALGMSMENTSPFDTTFVVGYANDNLGYLVTGTGLREGAYEARNVISLETEPCLLATTRAALDKAFA